MKKKSFFLSFLFVALLFDTEAQVRPAVFSKPLRSAPTNAGKEQLKENVRTQFYSTYPGAKNLFWSKTGDGYFTNFQSGDHHYTAWLNKKGETTSQIRFGTERDLPTEIRQRLRTVYDTKAIGLVREVKTCGQVVYLITIDELNSWKVVCVNDENIDLWEEHKKG